MKAPRSHTTSWVSEAPATDEVSVLSIAKVISEAGRRLAWIGND